MSEVVLPDRKQNSKDRTGGKRGKKRKGRGERGQVHVSWVSWGDGGWIEVLCAGPAQWTSMSWLGCVRKGFSWLLAPSAFALEI